jgi:hypothetical protein
MAYYRQALHFELVRREDWRMPCRSDCCVKVVAPLALEFDWLDIPEWTYYRRLDEKQMTDRISHKSASSMYSRKQNIRIVSKC